MIHDGVELPKLVPVAKAAEVLEISQSDIRELIDRGMLQSARVNGIVHVLTQTLADRLTEQTPARHNQDAE